MQAGCAPSVQPAATTGRPGRASSRRAESLDRAAATRERVIGYGDLKPTPDELKQMQAIVADAICGA